MAIVMLAWVLHFETVAQCDAVEQLAGVAAVQVACKPTSVDVRPKGGVWCGLMWGVWGRFAPNWGDFCQSGELNWIGGDFAIFGTFFAITSKSNHLL